MPDSFRADLDRRRFIVLAVAFGANLPSMAGSAQRYGSATIDAAIEIEDSRWIENLLRHMAPVLAT
jgi:hypothetical protein